MSNQSIIPENISFEMNIDTLHKNIHPYNQKLDGFLNSIESLFENNKSLIIV